MSIPRFKASNLTQAKHSVVGDCNGISCKDRFEIETELFADRLVSLMPPDTHTVLDYGCGMGRLAKAVLARNPKITVIGVDASEDELEQARLYVDSNRFIPILPENLRATVDFAYCIYVLQHVPAIELRHAIERMHHHLKPGGLLAYCSSDYRMAINAGGGFTDDAHLGVNIRREVGRLFAKERDMWPGQNEMTESELHILRSLIENYKNVPGGIPHPAIVYRRKQFRNTEPYFMVPFSDDASLATPAARQAEKPGSPDAQVQQAEKDAPTSLVLRNRLSPGDILVMTSTIRSLHKAYPGKFKVWVDSPCPDIFQNSGFVEHGPCPEDAYVIDMHYPLISNHEARGFQHPGSGISGRHFSDGHRKFLEEQLGVEIPRTGLTPDLFLDQNELLWPFLLKETGFDGKYWVLNAGSKNDMPLKQYHRWQEVVNLMRERLGMDIGIVQIGASEHNHAGLVGTIDLRGKTNHRQLYRLIAQSQGVISPVSYPMHIAAAFDKPCVVVAGGREGTRWELYPSHRFLHTNGALPCCAYDGCWKSKIEDCHAPVNIHPKRFDGGPEYVETVPKCMTLISPEDIVRAVELYYEGGMLQKTAKEEAHV